MPLDMIYASPPLSISTGMCSPPSGWLRYFSWLSAMAPLLDATRDTHVLFEHPNFLVMLPYGLLNTLSEQPPTSDLGEPYPEVFIFGSADAYTEAVKEPPSHRRMFDPSQAFNVLKFKDLSGFIAYAFRGSVYRCLSDRPAENLGRCVLEAAASYLHLPFDWVKQTEETCEYSADGAQDGLLTIANRTFWVQFTGGVKPGILHTDKNSSEFASNFFIVEGETQMQTGKALRRRKLYGDRTPERADVLHVAIGKAPSLALPHRPDRGVVWERETGTGEVRSFVQTITVHPLMIVGSVEPKTHREA